MYCATIPSVVSGSSKNRDLVPFLRGQRVNSEYVLPVTTAVVRAKKVSHL